MSGKGKGKSRGGAGGPSPGMKKKGRVSKTSIIKKITFKPIPKLSALEKELRRIVISPKITPPLDLTLDQLKTITGESRPFGVAVAPAPSRISEIFNATSGIENPIQKWVSRLYYHGNVADTMIAKGGDLVHDIGAGVQTKINGVSMIDFIGVNASADIVARVNEYVSRMPQIMRDFNTFRRDQFPPRIIFKNRDNLQGLTADLRANGVNYIIYDAAFGNIFKEGFGSGLTYIKSAASEVDGASKIGDDGLRAAGIIPREEYTSFSFPYFYGPNITHTLSIDRGIRRIAVSITQPGGAPVQTANIMCSKGISVNAICKLVGIEPPRGSGTAGSPITLVNNTIAPYSDNHIVFIKTMTDWAQLVYALLLTAMGLQCVFITNDEYCLALGAALGLPYMLRTPYAGCDYVELYEFDPTAANISPAEIATIRGILSAPIAADSRIPILINRFNKSRDRAIECMSRNNVPEIIRRMFYQDYNTAGRELHIIYSQFNSGVVDALSDDQIRLFRSLLTLSRDHYIDNEVSLRLARIYTKYVSFGVSLYTELHTNIATDTDTISRVVNIIRGFIGDDMGHIMEVFNSFRDKDGHISVFGDALPGGRKTLLWQEYYQYYLTAALPGAVFVPVKAGDEWGNQSLSLKRAMWEIVRNTPSLAGTITAPIGPCSKEIIPDAPAGVGESFVQVGGDNTDTLPDGTYPINDDIRKYIEAEIAFIYDVPSDSGFKPSCSKINDILDAAPESFPTVKEKIQWILTTLKTLQIDAFESNMGPDFEILMSNLDDVYELMIAGQITPTEMREQLEYVLTLNDVLIAIKDGISPDNQRALFNIIESIDVDQKSVNLKAATARGNMRSALKIAANIRGVPSAVSATAAAPTQGYGKITTLANLKTDEKPTNGIPQLVGVKTTGGARRCRKTRNHRRPRKHTRRRNRKF
jgi:hypothetical protein